VGLCDPKAIRNGKAWADVVNTPGFMNIPPKPVLNHPSVLFMNQEELRTLAYNCGAKPHTEGVMRAVTGVTMTYEQLTKLANELQKAERKRCCSIIFGQCSSDNTAQRTVDAIWKDRK
jgi:hypothetical protein